MSTESGTVARDFAGDSPAPLQRNVRPRTGPAATSLAPVMMMTTPVSVSPVESAATVISEPRPVKAKRRRNDDANHWWRRVEDRTRRGWRRVTITWRGCAVRLNYLSARIRAQSRPKREPDYGQCYHSKFLSHELVSLLLFRRLNPTIIAKLPKRLIRSKSL